MSHPFKVILNLLMVTSLLAPAIGFSKNNRNSHHRRIVETPVDNTVAQVFLGAVDLGGATYLLRSSFSKAFTTPDSIKLKGQISDSAEKLETIERRLADAKATPSQNTALIKEIEGELDQVKKLRVTQEEKFLKIMKKNGIGTRSLRIIGVTVFSFDLLGRLIVWNLLNDFPGYITDMDDIRNIAFNVFGIGDWEFGKDDGSRDREL